MESTFEMGIELDGTAGRTPCVEQEKSSNFVVNKEEKSRNKLNREEPTDGSRYHGNEENAEEPRYGECEVTNADVDANERGVRKVLNGDVSLIVIEDDKVELSTVEEMRNEESALTGRGKDNNMLDSKYNAEEDKTTTDSPEELLEVEVPGKMSVVALTGNVKDESANDDVVIGNKVGEKLKKKVKKTKKIVKKKQVKRNVLVNLDEVKLQSSELPEANAEQEKMDVNSEEKTEVYHGDKVNRVRSGKRKRRVSHKHTHQVDANSDESNLGGKVKEAVEAENTNEMKEANPGNKIKKVRKKGRSEVEKGNYDKLAIEGGDQKKVKLRDRGKKVRKKLKNGLEQKNVGQWAAVSELSKGEKSSSKVESKGMIFMCNSKTKEDCHRYKVLGLPSGKRDMVLEVYQGMRLFLFDVDSRLLYGIYKAAGPGGYNIEPSAFNSGFPSQVRFTVVKNCVPLPERKFKEVIKDNYYAKNKFNFQLSSEQVMNLSKLFKASGNVANSATVGGLAVVSQSAGKPERKITRAPEDVKRIGRKRRRAENDKKRDGKRKRPADNDRHKRNNKKSGKCNSRQHCLPPILSEGYPQPTMVYERQAYTPPTAHFASLLPALPPPREAHSLSSYTYGKTSLADGYGQDLALDHHIQGLTCTGVGYDLALDRPNQGLTYARVGHDLAPDRQYQGLTYARAGHDLAPDRQYQGLTYARAGHALAPDGQNQGLTYTRVGLNYEYGHRDSYYSYREPIIYGSSSYASSSGRENYEPPYHPSLMQGYYSSSASKEYRQPTTQLAQEQPAGQLAQEHHQPAARFGKYGVPPPPYRRY